MNKAIGDIHGKDVWKKYIDSEFDNFYFVGDYFDNYEETPTVTQIRNFREICDVARKNPNIHLCLGNHDFAYLRGVNEQYTGYQFYTAIDIQETLEENINLIKPVYQKGNYLISHAGITKTFLYRVLKLENPLDINTCFEENRNCLKFNGYEQYGDDITQGCTWVRPTSLLNDCLDNYKQIVGHTHFEKITTIDNITFTDCLDTVDEIYCF